MTDDKRPVHTFQVCTRVTGDAPILIEAEDFEVDAHGAHFIMDAGMESAFVVAFASHPFVIIQTRPAHA